MYYIFAGTGGLNGDPVAGTVDTVKKKCVKTTHFRLSEL